LLVRPRGTPLRIIANVPQKQFDAAVDIEKPPTVTARAEMGKGERPKGFIEATHVIGTPERFAEFFAANLARHRSAASRRFLAKHVMMGKCRAFRTYFNAPSNARKAISSAPNAVRFS
jgi:hypothetical protein